MQPAKTKTYIVSKLYNMTKISLLIFFISAFKLSFGQVDTTHVNGIILRIKEIKVTEYCPTTTIKIKLTSFRSVKHIIEQFWQMVGL
jgi:hypothetical protein